jgi:hypothetical protein
VRSNLNASLRASRRGATVCRSGPRRQPLDFTGADLSPDLIDVGFSSGAQKPRGRHIAPAYPALSSQFLCEQRLAAGWLCVPFDLRVQSPSTYPFVCRPEDLEDPRITCLRDWLVGAPRLIGLVAQRSTARAKRSIAPGCALWRTPVMRQLTCTERGVLRPEVVTTRVVDWDEATTAYLEPAIKLVVRRT